MSLEYSQRGVDLVPDAGQKPVRKSEQQADESTKKTLQGAGVRSPLGSNKLGTSLNSTGAGRSKKKRR